MVITHLRNAMFFAFTGLAVVLSLVATSTLANNQGHPALATAFLVAAIVTAVVTALGVVSFLIYDMRESLQMKDRKRALVNFPDSWHADYDAAQKSLSLNVSATMLREGPSFRSNMTALVGGVKVPMKWRREPTRSLGSATHFAYVSEDEVEPFSDETVNVHFLIGDTLDYDIVNEVTRDVTVNRR